jgi:tetratricopeptide (TPR) repeat protein
VGQERASKAAAVINSNVLQHKPKQKRQNMKQIMPLIFILTIGITFAQNDAILDANKLIDNKKYESAIKVLNDADPTNKNPEIVIAKTDLYLKYFVTSIMHKMFALKDLEADEDIMDYRGSNGNFTMFAFAPDSVLNLLIEKYSENYNLRKTLGYYYHEVHLKYQQNWFEPDSVVINRFFDNYKIAFDNGIYDYWSAYGLGYAYLMQQEYESAIPYLEKSTELKKDYPSSHYNLAYAYLYTDQREQGIESAKKAMDLYDYPQYKADAARMIAVMYRELEDFENSIDFYKQADKIQPNDYYTLKPLLDLEISLNKENYQVRTNQFFAIAPGNPTIYQDLMKMYWYYEKIEELLTFLASQHDNYHTDHKVMGNIYFYTAVIQYDKKDFKYSKDNFEKSREIFKKVYEPNHRVFEVIDSYTNNIQ